MDIYLNVSCHKILMEKNYILRTFIVEEDTNDGKKAVKIMNNSGLPYELIKISKKEVDGSRKNYGPVLRLLSDIGFFDGIYSIEWSI